jgi:hypothetical protein
MPTLRKNRKGQRYGKMAFQALRGSKAGGPMRRSDKLSDLGLGPVYILEASPNIELEKLMRQVSEACDDFMSRNGCVRPMYHIVCREGFHLIVDPIGDKDEIAQKIRALLKVADAVAYAFCDEAWIASYKDDEVKEGRPNVMPKDRPNREEVVLIQAESEREGELTGIRKIIRKDDKPTLGPLEIERWTNSAGRLVGMLPKRGKGH